MSAVFDNSDVAAYNNERLLPAAHGKYDVSRQLAAAPSRTELNQLPLLKAA